MNRVVMGLRSPREIAEAIDSGGDTDANALLVTEDRLRIVSFLEAEAERALNEGYGHEGHCIRDVAALLKSAIRAAQAGVP